MERNIQICELHKNRMAAQHALVHLAVQAHAYVQVFLAQLIYEKWARQQRKERDSLLIEFAKLIEPTNRIIRFWLAMCEADHSLMSNAWIALLAFERRHRAGILSRKKSYCLQ